MTDEVETMFSHREVPWHRKGTIVLEKLTAKEALVEAGLDWEVEMFPVYAKVERDDGEGIQHDWVLCEDQQAVVRDSDNTVLSVRGSRYTPVQNWKSFEFFDDLVDDGSAKYETAGSLDDGRKIWLTAFVPREIKILGEDAVELYLLLANSHDASLSLTVAVTPNRVVCRNTLNLALRNVRQQWTMKHTESIDGRLAEAREALGMTFEYADVFEREMNELAQASFTKAQFEVMVKDVFPTKEESADRFSEEQYALIGTFESSPTLQDGIRYTKWGALNAVREFDDWGREFRGSKSKSQDEQRLERAWFGPNVRNANRVLQYLQG